MNQSNRFELVGLEIGMVLAAGRLFGPLGYTDLLLALDTGSGMTVIAPDLLRLAGISSDTPREERLTYTLGGRVNLPVMVVPRLRVFGKEVSNLEVMVRTLPHRLGIDGVLGLNFLRHFDLRINFRQEFLELR
jgi:hypothetical protein